MEQDQIIDAENYRSPDKFTFKEIVMRQLQRVVTNMSQEMRAGFWIYNQASNLQTQKNKYVGDSRKELLQSVNVLHDLLLPKFDDTMKEKSEAINKEFSSLYETNNKQSSEATKLAYWNKALKIYRSLFQELCFFLEREGWLEQTDITEE